MHDTAKALRSRRTRPCSAAGLARQNRQSDDFGRSLRTTLLMLLLSPGRARGRAHVSSTTHCQCALDACVPGARGASPGKIAEVTIGARGHGCDDTSVRLSALRAPCGGERSRSACHCASGAHGVEASFADAGPQPHAAKSLPRPPRPVGPPCVDCGAPATLVCGLCAQRFCGDCAGACGTCGGTYCLLHCMAEHVCGASLLQLDGVLARNGACGPRAARVDFFAVQAAEAHAAARDAADARCDMLALTAAAAGDCCEARRVRAEASARVRDVDLAVKAFLRGREGPGPSALRAAGVGQAKLSWADWRDEEGGLEDLLRCEAWGVAPEAFEAMHGCALSPVERRLVLGCARSGGPASSRQARGGGRRPYRHWRARACVDENARWGKRSLPWGTRLAQAVGEELADRRKQRRAELLVLVRGEERAPAVCSVRKTRSTHARRLREAAFQWRVCDARERRSALLATLRGSQWRVGACPRLAVEAEPVRRPTASTPASRVRHREALDELQRKRAQRVFVPQRRVPRCPRPSTHARVAAAWAPRARSWVSRPKPSWSTCFDPRFSEQAGALLRRAERVGGRRVHRRRRRPSTAPRSASRQASVKAVSCVQGCLEDCGSSWLSRRGQCLPLALLRLADAAVRLRLSLGLRRVLRNDARCGAGSAQSVRNMVGVQRVLRQLSLCVDVLELGGCRPGSTARLWRLGAGPCRSLGTLLWCAGHVYVFRGSFVCSASPSSCRGVPPWLRSCAGGPARRKSADAWRQEIESYCAWKQGHGHRLPTQSRAASSEERRWALWLKHVVLRRNVPEECRAAWEGSCPELFAASSSASAPVSAAGDTLPASTAAEQPSEAAQSSEEQQRCLALTRLPVNPGLCLARTWRGAQCTNRRSKRSDYCAQHGKLPVLKEGRYDCELAEEVALEYARKAASFVRPFACRYYCRTRMWDEAEALGLRCVEDLSDEQYAVALRSVHDYYRKSSVREEAVVH